MLCFCHLVCCFNVDVYLSLLTVITGVYAVILKFLCFCASILTFSCLYAFILILTFSCFYASKLTFSCFCASVLTFSCFCASSRVILCLRAHYHGFQFLGACPPSPDFEWDIWGEMAAGKKGRYIESQILWILTIVHAF